MNPPDIAAAMTALVQTPNVSVAWSVRRADGRETEHQADAPMEAGSAFKAIVAAECCRQVERGDLDQGSHEGLDGATIALDEAVRAMVTASDNTATDLVIGRIGHEAVVRLTGELGLRDMRVPASVKELYAEPEDEHIAAFTTTMRDLRTFYDIAFREELFLEPATHRRFLAFLRGEDEEQGTPWPNEVTCYRKSGSLENEHLLAQAIAGAFTREGAVATWAFAINQRPSPLDGQPAMFDAISQSLGVALSSITGTFGPEPSP